jgi:hypothetical protein
MTMQPSLMQREGLLALSSGANIVPCCRRLHCVTANSFILLVEVEQPGEMSCKDLFVVFFS